MLCSTEFTNKQSVSIPKVWAPYNLNGCSLTAASLLAHVMGLLLTAGAGACYQLQICSLQCCQRAPEGVRGHAAWPCWPPQQPAEGPGGAQAADAHACSAGRPGGPAGEPAPLNCCHAASVAHYIVNSETSTGKLCAAAGIAALQNPAPRLPRAINSKQPAAVCRQAPRLVSTEGASLRQAAARMRCPAHRCWQVHCC